MKKILLAILLLLGTLSIQAQEIRWMSLDEALAKQKKNPKPILMNVYTDWYGPCKMMDANTFHDGAVADFINKNYYAVRFNAEGNSTVNYQGTTYTNPGYDPNRKGRNSAHDLTKFLKVQQYPSIFVIGKGGSVQTSIVGYRTPEQLLNDLR